MATRLAACRGASPGANRACIGVPAMPFHWVCASVISCTRLCPGYRPPVPCKRVSVISHLLHKVMPGIRTTGALHKGERHKSFPERLGPGYRPPMPCKRVSVHSAFNEGEAMPESMPRQSRATKHFGPLRDHCRLEPIPITLWDRPVSECVRTRSPTHSNGPIGDASRPMIESSREIRRESQKKLPNSLVPPKHLSVTSQ